MCIRDRDNHRAGAFAEYTGDVPAAAAYTDEAFLRLSAESLLSMQSLETGDVEFVDFGVQDFAALGGKLYYITSTAGQSRLKEFDPAQMSWRMLASLSAGVTPVSYTHLDVYKRQMEGDGDELFTDLTQYRGNSE